MTIEVKQLLIKSKVLQRLESDDYDGDLAAEFAQLKADILAECKIMMIDLLSNKNER